MMLEKYSLIYPLFREPVTAEMCETYLLFLGDLSVEDLKYGLVEAGKHEKAFPTPGVVRGYVTGREARQVETAAVEALASLDRLVEQFGRSGLGTWGKDGPTPRGSLDAAGEYALRDIGGWAAYCDRTEQGSPFMRKDFLAAYRRWNGYEKEHGPLIGEAAKMIEDLGASVGDLSVTDGGLDE